MISGQFARPRGLLGRLVGRTMARHNAVLTHRVVAALGLRGDETVVEFGPGPGVGLRLLAEALPDGRVIGVEPSPVMRRQAAGRTRRFGDRVELVDATAATVGLPAESVDAVCAVNNVQLWQPLAASLARVAQLLRPGGVVAFGVTEHAVLPDGGSVGRGFDSALMPQLTRAGFTDLTAVWQPGGNGEELLVEGRRAHRHAT
ncbi:class I SAM-dependent methyltransferase [Rugosimonospora acidiphila]